MPAVNVKAAENLKTPMTTYPHGIEQDFSVPVPTQ